MASVPDLGPIPDFDQDLLAGLDNWIVDRTDPEVGPISRNEAVNRILRDWLSQEGYLELPTASVDFDDPTH